MWSIVLFELWLGFVCLFSFAHYITLMLMHIEASPLVYSREWVLYSGPSKCFKYLGHSKNLWL